MGAQLEGQAASVKLYTVGGRLLSVEAAEERLALMAETFFGGFYFIPHDGARTSREADIRLLLSTGEPPPVPPDFSPFKMRVGVCRSDGETYHLALHDSRIVVGPPASKTIEVWFGDTQEARHPVAQINVMSYLMHVALRRCSVYDLHAGGAVEPESGGGVLLVGPSNCGKSSLTLRLARSGWKYLSDDLLLLSEGAGGVEARGLRRFFAVSAASLAGCDLPRLEEALGPPVNSDPNKRRLEPEIVFPGGFAESCRPRAIFFPHVTGEAASRVEELGQSEVLIRLLKQCPWTSFDATARTYMRYLGALVRQARGYTLHAGRDLLTDAGLAARMLSEYVPR